MRALAKDPGERYANGEEFVQELEEARAAIASGADGGQDTAAFAAISPPAPVPVEPADAGPAPPEPYGAEGGGRRWPWVAAALLAVLLAGAAVWALTRPNQVRVPAVVGEKLLPARDRLERAGFDVGVERVFDTRPADTVIDQDPNAREKVDKGSKVTLEVSNGPAQRGVPSVEGLPEKEAVKQLNRAGFKLDIDSESSTRFAKGIAIRTVPSGGEQADLGTPIRLFVSSGPQRVVVPGVVGQSRDSAESERGGDHLRPVIDEQSSDKPKDEVISQSPIVGTEVDEGSQVAIVISKGPQKVEVPSVVGFSEGRARATLRRDGFGVEVRDRTTDSQTEDGTVLDQLPGAGTEIRKGRTVVIYVGRFTAPTP